MRSVPEMSVNVPHRVEKCASRNIFMRFVKQRKLKSEPTPRKS